MPSRRELLTSLGASAGALALGGCDPLVGAAARLAGGDVPARVGAPNGRRISPARHLLNRAAYGPWPGDETRVETIGPEAWLEEQLHPARIDDTACDIRTAFIDTLNLPSDLAFEIRPEVVEAQLTAHTILKAVYSRRQLYEVMVGFWTDHFHVAIAKAECRHLTAIHVRDAVRRHALDRFPDLLRATALSPAMLVYLDGRDNAVADGREVPNENYARELLELHTLGVDGGYTQDDVMEAARCLTGWVVRDRFAPGAVEFVPSRHDDGDKRVLGRRIPPGGGARDLDRLLSVLVSHPSCSRYVSRRLCRRLVADDPPDAVVDAASRTFQATEGDIPAVLRTILGHEAFAGAADAKVKRPFRFVVSALRGLGAETHARGDLTQHLTAMGHAPYQHPTPDGYPEDAADWMGTLLPRFRFALALCDGSLSDTRVDFSRLRDALGDVEAELPRAAFAHLVGRRPTTTEARMTSLYHRFGEADAREARVFSLILSSPGFQRC